MKENINALLSMDGLKKSLLETGFTVLGSDGEVKVIVDIQKQFSKNTTSPAKFFSINIDVPYAFHDVEKFTDNAR